MLKDSNNTKGGKNQPPNKEKTEGTNTNEIVNLNTTTSLIRINGMIQTYKRV